MDYDFHLFTDIGTGEDSVLYRSGPTGYRLAQAHPQPTRAARWPCRSPSATCPPPRMPLAGAEQRLDIGGLPFVFFADDTTGRGNALYHRYDGHYGLITTSE